MEDSQDFVVYPSEFMDGMNITVIFKENDRYNELVPIFEKFGYGFVAPEFKTIIVDGEALIGDDGLTMDDLRFIEAHEISHLKLGHNGPRSMQDELEADLGAYVLLKQKGYDKSIQRLIEEFEYRHGMEFNEDLLDKIKDRFQF